MESCNIYLPEYLSWQANPGLNPVWEQAFSGDDGKTWETNWVMEFVRR